jgi:hypothetical protein
MIIRLILLKEIHVEPIEQVPERAQQAARLSVPTAAASSRAAFTVSRLVVVRIARTSISSSMSITVRLIYTGYPPCDLVS